MKLSVYLNLGSVRHLVGLLDERNGEIYFEYDATFRTSGLELSPFKLPLRSGVFHDERKTFDGLFGLFNDSLPDGWGCLLLDRKLRRRGLSYDAVTPLARLALIGRNPMGALEYEPSDSEAESIGTLSLDSLAGEVDRILAGDEVSDLDNLLSLNGSSGGARPKIVAWVSPDRKEIVRSHERPGDGWTEWLIKFMQKNDPSDLGETEYKMSLAAKAAGITMPETHLFPSKRCPGYFGVQRFDRTSQGKVHIHTACGLLHASHRYSSLDYEALLKLTLVLTRDRRDVEEMVRRMCFNVKFGNRDDHSKNFAFLLDPQGKWRLAPAYDLTPSAGLNGEQTAMVNGKGRGITDADLIAAASTVDIPSDRVKAILRTLDDIKI